MRLSKLLLQGSAPVSLIGDLSIHACVGVIQSPSRGMLQGEPEWSCKLLLTECGSPAQWPPALRTVATQQVFRLRCRGVAMAGYCFANLREGEVVHVVSKLVHKPRYITVHGTYFTATELLVTDSLGSIVSVAQLV
ncbi:conserved hypothetical protein [Leishmania braziliensis MHOM/BR/75/M2904]|uniref:Uncharacterized protein n=2 Tax=Leishmania braziliensis TaxID=5660 RepID=A4HQL5_LEIBR|nr:conserved hypothetical protein [Leishmania braziliensis MHOM/BR/75/M2904]CAJ2482400.1 unnamed protein product [Leishmania braziliensis]CAJ2482612.1 unnamed protein product [Leishmania braziliensis]CAM44484.1 conserved hypothetical protein [Leishmania braziliensis MHOM/BR/75/M2904]SYZ70563.1 hypothetical_protein [Leishmania braziliensis MHOM/BR/75/M2904]